MSDGDSDSFSHGGAREGLQEKESDEGWVRKMEEDGGKIMEENGGRYKCRCIRSI